MFGFIKQNFQSHQTTWGLLTGVILGTGFILWIQNDVLAVVLGVLVAILVAHPGELRTYCILGCATGIIIGPVAGVRQYLSAAPKTPNLPVLLFEILGWLILSSVLGALYGFIMGKFVQLYGRGQGPFF